MVNQFINVYKNNPTEGAKDGTLVSSDATYTSPIKLILSKVDYQSIKLAIRTEQGYKTTGETTIKVVDMKNATTLSWENNMASTTEISTTEPITDTNKIFYLQTMSVGLETGMDTDIDLQVLYKIAAAD